MSTANLSEMKFSKQCHDVWSEIEMSWNFVCIHDSYVQHSAKLNPDVFFVNGWQWRGLRSNPIMDGMVPLYKALIQDQTYHTTIGYR